MWDAAHRCLGCLGRRRYSCQTKPSPEEGLLYVYSRYIYIGICIHIYLYVCLRVYIPTCGLPGVEPQIFAVV